MTTPSTVETAFADVVAKARGGVLGAATGVGVMLLLLLTLAGPNADRAGCLAIGAIGGAAGGAIMSGRYMGMIGVSIITSGHIALLISIVELSRPNHNNYVVLGIVAAGVTVGFTVGAALQIWQARRAAEPRIDSIRWESPD